MSFKLPDPLEGKLEDWDQLPTYVDFFNKTIIATLEFGSFTKYPTDYAFMKNLLTSFTAIEITLAIAVALLFTFARKSFNCCILVPLGKWLLIRENELKKFYESAWKCIIYSFLWSFSFYFLILSEKYNFCTYTCRVFRPIDFHKEYFNTRFIPFDVSLIYLFQVGFYLHSIYATIYMDVWRKDSVTMLVHHIISVTALFFSYGARYYELGTCLLLLHDINDVFMELAKLQVYLKSRAYFHHPINEHLATLFFGLFAISWFYTRLYLYPLKILHATNWCAYLYHKDRTPNLWCLLNSLLWPLYFMHIYWFVFILGLVKRVLTGQSDKLDDNREFAITQKTEKNASKKNL